MTTLEDQDLAYRARSEFLELRDALDIVQRQNAELLEVQERTIAYITEIGEFLGTLKD